MQARNSNPPILFAIAKFATFRSNVAAPTSIVVLSIKFILEKLDPSLTTIPLTPLSLINVFEPAPSIVIFNFVFWFSLKIQLIVFYFQV